VAEDREGVRAGRERALVPEGYPELLGDLKERIRSAQIRAALSVNRELIALYWQIGRAISERQETHGWGTQVIDRLSADLRRAFPDMRGFSPRNLRYMRTFAAAYPDADFWQQAAANLPWGTSCGCSTRSPIRARATGMRTKRSSMAGVAPS
jgi:predicted nuclease of restriction endonuclease-like (RecB) superfamily